MNIEAIVFLIIIGIIVILTVTEKNDPLDKGIIDFKESHDINGDIKKLKARIKDDAKAARDTKKLFITLIIIIVVILAGFLLVSYDLIFNKAKDDLIINSDEKNNDDDNEKGNDTKEDYDKDKDKDDNISLESLGVVSDYIKEAQKADDCDKEAIIKTAEYHKEKIENNLLELYLVKDNKYVSVKASDNLNKLLDSYFRSQSYEKLFVIDGDGNLTKYIFICK